MLAAKMEKPSWFVIMLGAVVALWVFWPQQIKAQIRIDITQGNIDPLAFAMPDLHTETAHPLIDTVRRVILADLESSGLFRAMNKAGFLSNPKLSELPDFNSWRPLGARILAVGSLEEQQDGRLRLEIRLWDTQTARQYGSARFEADAANVRRLAHKAADFCYFQITGERGYFDSRIVFVREAGEKINRRKMLAIVDQDGENIQTLLDDPAFLALTPRFSPTRQEIAFLALYPERPAEVFLFDLISRRKRQVGSFEGMSFAPRYTPDGQGLLLSIEANGNSDVYLMNLRSLGLQRLTRNLAIDTTPSMAPDGNRIVFASDRGGSQQLYVMNTDGSNARRISYGGSSSYGTPVWSPRGDLIAFTRLFENKFSIGVIRPDGTGERVLTEGVHYEAPSWSPNGRRLIFFREPSYRSGANQLPSLWTIDITGRHMRRMALTVGASDPAWSPLLP